MVNIFDVPVMSEMPFLEDLAEDLEGTLLCIAYAGMSSDISYIKERQKYFREKYGKFLDNVISDVGGLHIIPAYEALQEILKNNNIPEDIERDARDALYEHLIIDEETLTDDSDPFTEYYESCEDSKDC